MLAWSRSSIPQKVRSKNDAQNSQGKKRQPWLEMCTFWRDVLEIWHQHIRNVYKLYNTESMSASCTAITACSTCYLTRKVG